MKPNFTNAYLLVEMNKSANSAFCGRVTGPRLDAPLLFDDISGLLLLVDAVLTEQNYPRAFQKKRVFAVGQDAPALTAQTLHAQSAETEKSGEYTHAFTLHITSRHNTSWQGMVDWMDGRPRVSFASELEFLRLLEKEF